MGEGVKRYSTRPVEVKAFRLPPALDLGALAAAPEWFRRREIYSIDRNGIDFEGRYGTVEAEWDTWIVLFPDGSIENTYDPFFNEKFQEVSP